MVKHSRIPLFLLLVASLHGAPCALAGTGDTGGGDYPKDKPVSDQDVTAAIDRARILASFVVQYIESTQGYPLESTRSPYRPGNGRDELPFSPDVMSRIAGRDANGKDVYARLGELRFAPSPKACRDELGQPKAASAHPENSNEICFSLPLIRANAQRASLDSRVLALAVHEIAHKMGLKSEMRARELEGILKKALPADPWATVRDETESLFLKITDKRGGTVLSLTNEILAAEEPAQADTLTCLDQVPAADRATPEFLSVVKEIVERAQKNPLKGETCFKLARLLSLTDELNARVEHANVPLEILRPELTKRLHPSAAQRRDIEAYCSGDSRKRGAVLDAVQALRAGGGEALAVLKGVHPGLVGPAQAAAMLEPQ